MIRAQKAENYAEDENKTSISGISFWNTFIIAFLSFSTDHYFVCGFVPISNFI